jgi:response regulator RpfG family c-di-GMP phosphodiesterase
MNLGTGDRTFTGIEAARASGDFTSDHRRKQLLWLAMALIGLLGLALVLIVAYGEQMLSADYGEPLLLIGLLAFLTCTVAYFADKERQYRIENRSLIQQLHDTAEALDARVARLNKICETSSQLAGALNVGRISDLVVEALVGQVRADAASLVLLDKSKGECLHSLSKGPLAEAVENGEPPEAVARAAAGEAGPAMRWLKNPPDVAQQIQAWGKVQATISAPLRVSEVIGGALAAVRHDSFDTEDLNLLTTLANMAAKAIESAELHEELRQSYFRTLHVLARSLAARDPYSAAHGEAVTWLSCRIATELGLDDEALEALRAYCPLHDLGKIGIPDSILLKYGPLTDEELEMCRQHAAIGEEIMRPLNPGPAVLSMIRNHHERWDGGGYPDGLKGEEIPLLARVVAGADTFHAMVSHRPYRPGTVFFPALQEIRALAGSQFDPSVVQALCALWDNGELAKFSMRLSEFAEPGEVMKDWHSIPAPPALSH